jgi:hypothetical protein
LTQKAAGVRVGGDQNPGGHPTLSAVDCKPLIPVPTMVLPVFFVRFFWTICGFWQIGDLV